MTLRAVNLKGIYYEYYTTLTGNINHLTIQLAYADDGGPIFTDESLLTLRDFLYKHHVESVEFNPPAVKASVRQKNTITAIKKMYEALGERLGDLIKSVPTIKTVSIDEVAHELTSDNTLQDFRDAFQWSMTPKLCTSIGQPALYMRVQNRSMCGANTLPFKIDEVTYSVDYEDRRSRRQKIYDYCAHLPLLGRLVRYFDHCCKHDSERRHFTETKPLNGINTESIDLEAAGGRDPAGPSAYLHPVHHPQNFEADSHSIDSDSAYLLGKV